MKRSKRATFTSLWGIIPSYFRILPSQPSFTIQSCGRLGDECPAFSVASVARRSVADWLRICPAAALQGFGVLFGVNRRGSRSVRARCGGVSSGSRGARAFYVRRDYPVGRSERSAIKRLSTRHMAKRVAREGRTESLVRTLHATWRSLVRLSCRGLQR